MQLFLEKLDKYKLREHFKYKMKLKGINLLQYGVKKICYSLCFEEDLVLPEYISFPRIAKLYVE